MVDIKMLLKNIWQAAQMLGVDRQALCPLTVNTLRQYVGRISWECKRGMKVCHASCQISISATTTNFKVSAIC